MKYSAGVLFFLFAMPSLSFGTDTFPARDGNIEITPLIHASVKLAYNGTIIHVDPWSRLDLSDQEKADLILVTDDSGHHLDERAIARLRKPHTSLILPSIAVGRYPEGIVMANGDNHQVGNIGIEAIAAYDIIPGEPAHLKGEANGYVLSLGGQRLYFAGVTECVPEVKAVQDIAVAFMPMNIPVGRMTPSAAAECTAIIDPEVVYLYHYDQSYALRASNSSFPGWDLPGGISVAESLALFREALAGTGIEVRDGAFYPELP